MVKRVVSFPDAGWIARQLERYRLPRKRLASALGLDPSAVTRLLNGSRGLRPEERGTLVRFLREHNVVAVNEEAVREGLRRIADISPLALALQTTQMRLHDIQRGASMSDDEIGALAFVVDDGGALPTSSVALTAVDDTIPIFAAPAWSGAGWWSGSLKLAERRHPPTHLVGVEGAFGLYVGTDHLSPMFRPSDLLYVHPGKPVVIGDRALARAEGDRWALGLVEAGPRAYQLRWHERHRPIIVAPEVSLSLVVAVDFN